MDWLCCSYLLIYFVNTKAFNSCTPKNINFYHTCYNWGTLDRIGKSSCSNNLIHVVITGILYLFISILNHMAPTHLITSPKQQCNNLTYISHSTWTEFERKWRWENSICSQILLKITEIENNDGWAFPFTYNFSGPLQKGWAQLLFISALTFFIFFIYLTVGDELCTSNI